jgi:alpha-L-fucosidase 2
MLLQCQLPGTIDLLPALPKAWPTGSVKGLRARGGFEVDIDWKDGKLTRATILSTLGRRAVVRYAGQTITARIEAPAGQRVVFDGALRQQ